jgi:hypothetical protein
MKTLDFSNQLVMFVSSAVLRKYFPRLTTAEVTGWLKDLPALWNIAWNIPSTSLVMIGTCGGRSIIRNSVTPASGTKKSPFRLLYRRDPMLPIDNALFCKQSSSSVAQAEADREISHAADHIHAARNMTRYYSRMQEHVYASRKPASISKGDLVYAHKPDAKRGKISHTWRGPYMIVGSHLGSRKYTLHTFIYQKAQRATRNINDWRPFLNTDDSDKTDNSDVLSFPQLLPSLKPTWL